MNKGAASRTLLQDATDPEIVVRYGIGGGPKRKFPALVDLNTVENKIMALSCLT